MLLRGLNGHVPTHILTVGQRAPIRLTGAMFHHHSAKMHQRPAASYSLMNDLVVKMDVSMRKCLCVSLREPGPGGVYHLIHNADRRFVLLCEPVKFSVSFLRKLCRVMSENVEMLWQEARM